MRNNYKIINESYINNLKTTECFIEAELDINSLDKGFKVGNIYKMIKCDPYWYDIIKKYNKQNNINISSNIINIKVQGKSICSDDDGFDEKIGNNIAKRRALIKLYNIFGSILKDISDILTKRFTNIYIASVNYKKKSINLKNSTHDYINKQSINYWI